MFGTGVVEIFLGVDAEQKSLEEIASPVSAAEAGTSGGTVTGSSESATGQAPGQRSTTGRARIAPDWSRPPLSPADRARLPRWLWAPFPQASTFPRSDPYRRDEVERVVAVLGQSSPLSLDELADRTGGRYWGPGRLRRAVRAAVDSGRVRPLRRDRYELAENAVPAETRQVIWGE